MLGYRLTRRPFSLFSLFFPEIISGGSALFRKKPRLAGNSDREKQLRALLLSAVFRCSSPALSSDRMTWPRRPSCFCRESAGTSYFVAITPRRSKHRLLLFCHSDYRLAAWIILRHKCAIVNSQIASRLRMPEVLAKNVAAPEHAAVVRDHVAMSPSVQNLTRRLRRARVRRKWQYPVAPPQRPFTFIDSNAGPCPKSVVV